MKNNFRKIFFIVLGIILLFTIFLDTYIILKNDVLPTKYLIIYGIAIVLIPIIMVLYTWFRKKHQKVKGVFAIIEMIYIIILLMAFGYLNKTFNFLDNITASFDYETKNYYVLVLKDSELKSEKDLDNKSVGYSSVLDDSSEKAIEELKKKFKINIKDFDGYTNLYESLDNSAIDAAVMLSNSYDVLIESEIENNENDKFTEKYRILNSFYIKEEVKPLETKGVDITKESFNVYVSGMDSFGSITDKSRSDVNIVMNVNLKTNKVLLVTIPRDYYVEFHGTGKKDKLTHAGVQGINMSVNTIEDLLDVDINYYIKVNFNAIIKLTEALGGVDVYSEHDFNSLHYKYNKGYNNVKGEKALEFVRTRKAFKEGDRVRGENQQAMITAIINKLSSSALLYKFDDILKSMEGNFITSIPKEDINAIIKMQLKNNPKWEIKSISLNGTDSYVTTFSGQQMYVMLPIDETVNAEKEALKENS